MTKRRGKIAITYYDSPCGQLALGAYGDSLCLCDWTERKRPEVVRWRLEKMLGASFAQEQTDISRQAVRQLDEYFAGRRREFTMPLLPVGTEFQLCVWDALPAVGYAQTITYQHLAEKIGRLQAMRAVGSAVGSNALSIFLPCHRVVGTTRKSAGYAGGPQAKRYLLEMEKNNALA